MYIKQVEIFVNQWNTSKRNYSIRSLSKVFVRIVMKQSSNRLVHVTI